MAARNVALQESENGLPERAGGWKILHVDLSQIGAVALEPGYQGLYLCFWHERRPLGHHELLAGELPLSHAQVRDIAVRAIARAVFRKLADGDVPGALDADGCAVPGLLPRLSEAWRREEASFQSQNVSLVICTRDRPDRLRRCLESVAALSFQAAEIIVVDNGSRREATRRKLLEAAGQMIGKYGFAGCTIARVTARARIAHGTFYLHFQSQQEMFEELLREMSLRMLEHVRDAVHECGSLVELERRGLEANHDFFCRYPFMARLTQEAELYSPVSYTAHIDAMANGYVRALARKRAGTVLEGWSHAQLEQLAVMLIGARSQIMRRYGVAGHKVVPLSPDVIDTYIRFISNGILAGLDKPAADRTEGAQAPTGERD